MVTDGHRIDRQKPPYIFSTRNFIPDAFWNEEPMPEIEVYNSLDLFWIA